MARPMQTASKPSPAATGSDAVTETGAHLPLIAHVIHRLDVGGLENGLVNLINHMPRDRYRHAVVCLTDYADYRFRIAHDVALFALHKREGKDLGLYLRLWRVFRTLKPDVVHTRNLAALEAQLPALLAGVPCRIHGEHGRDVEDVDGTSRRYRLLRKAFRPFVHRYVALSRELEHYLRARIAVADGKIARICNGVDVERFRPARERKPLPSLFPSGCVVIGSVGRMEAIKNPHTLARAFVRLVAQVPNGRERLRLALIGDGRLRGQVEEALREAGLLDIAWLPGMRDDIPELLRAMDVFVLPSLAEGISNTVLEAMASGLPVVATDVGGNTELVTEGETGCLVPRGDAEAMAQAIRRYVDDAELRARHGRAARRRAERDFSLDEMVRRYTALYDGLLAQKNG